MAYSLIATLSAGLGQHGGTSPAVDTTGADFLVLIASSADPSHGTSPPTLTDSKGNTWYRSQAFQESFDTSVLTYYSVPTSVGTGHTFTFSGSNLYAAIVVYAFAGAHQIMPLDVSSGNAKTGASPIAAGSILPSADDALIVSALSWNNATAPAVDSGLTQTTVTRNPSNWLGVAGGWRTQSTAFAIDPQWTWSGSSEVCAVTIAFRPAGAGDVAPLLAWTQATPAPTGGTSPAIDTTGATLLVYSLAYISTFGPVITVSDSKGNTWIPLTERGIGGGEKHRFYYAKNPIVGAGHTFTVTTGAANGHPSIIVYAFDGTDLDAPFDVESGASSAAGEGTLATGSITPAADHALIVTAIACGNATPSTVVPGTLVRMVVPYTAAAYQKQDTRTAINPSWTWGGGGGPAGTQGAAVAVAAFKAPPETRRHRVTQLVREVAYGEDAEPITPDEPCTGGGDVAAGINPAPGPDLSTASAPLAWIEITLVDGTVQRWAKATIPHGLPKFGRVLSFGRIARRLSDGDGGPQASTVTTTLADTDRALRVAAFAGTLHFARVDYYVADLETVRAGGAPQRVFCGRVQEWSADPRLQFSITVQDELSARLTSARAQDAQSPIRMIDRTVHDNQPLEALYGKAAPEIYGSLSDQRAEAPVGQGGTWETRHIQDITIDPGPLAALGQLSMFLVCAGAVGKVQSVYLGDPDEDPPVSRVKAPADAFGDWLFAPTVAGGWFTDDPNEQYWDPGDGRRWTVILGVAAHPSIRLAVEGRIPIVLNVCGYEEVGDSSGRTLERPIRAFVHWLNNRVLEDVGGDWRATLEDLGGYSLFDTASVAAIDAICESRGYRVAGVIGHDHEFRSWRERVAEWCLNFGFDVGTNRHGQIVLVLLDRDSSTVPIVAALTPAVLLESGVRVTMRADGVENIVPYVYARNYLSALQDMNPRTGERGLREPRDMEWYSDAEEVADEASIAALGGHPKGERRARRQEYGLVRDATTADRVAAERLALNAPPNGRAEITCDLLLRDGWALELGNVLTLEHWDLPWSGTRRCQVRALDLDLDAMVVTLTARDVDDLLFTMPVSTSRIGIGRIGIMRIGAS